MVSYKTNDRPFPAAITALAIGFMTSFGAVGEEWGNKLPSAINVSDFGAEPNASLDNSQAISKALNQLSQEHGGRIVIPPGVYRIDETIEFPKFGGNAVVEFEMTGATLKTEKPIAIFRRMMDSQEEAMRAVGAVFRFHGGRFLGSSLPGQVGLQLSATYSSLLDGVQFEALDIGFDGHFNLGLRIENVRATANAKYDIKIGTAVSLWPGATMFNAGSNHTTFDSVRIYSAKNSIANIAIFGASGVTIRNCIVEGADPQNAILYDNEGAVAQVFIVDNLHSESTPSNAIIKITGKKAGMIYSISNVFFQTATTLLDARDIGVSTIEIRNIPYISSLKEGFKLSPGAGGVYGTLWRFENWPGDIFASRLWSGGLRPENLFSIGRNDPSYGTRIASDKISLGVRGKKSQVDVEGELTSHRFCLTHGPGDLFPMCVDKEGLRRLLNQ